MVISLRARFTNVASLSSIPVTFLEFHYDFWAAYLLTTVALCVSILLFIIWSKKLSTSALIPHIPKSAHRHPN